MDAPPLKSRIEELEKENRILRNKLARSEQNRAELEEMIETHTTALKIRNQELEDSKEKLRASEAGYRELALHDTLTALPNRSYFNLKFEDIIAYAKAENKSVALLYMDLNLFKTINDGLGHKAGDEVLIQTGARLLSCVRNDDIVARLGGDEFAIILTEIEAPYDAENVAVRVLDAITSPYRVGDRFCGVGVSIGISVFPEDAEESEKLMQYADLAMYSVKKSGENHYQLYRKLKRP